MSDLEAQIAEVIAGNDKEHAFRMADYSDNERPIYRCACGVEAIGMHHKHHRKALAAALLAMIREAQAEAWDKGAFDASMSLDHGGHNANNPYKEES